MEATRRDGSVDGQIETARNIQQVGAACRRAAETLGYRYFQFGFRVPVSLTRPCQIVLSGYPQEWRTWYDDCGYLTIDPVVQRALGSVLPFGWDELALETPEAQRLFAEAARYGLAHGFSVPVHGAHGESALFSFARGEALPAGAVRAEQFRHAHWLTALIHERLRTLVYEGEGIGRLHRRLTRRERQCLQLAAEGLSATAIGRGMKISEHTVNFHLVNAEAKLGARSRRHAVARAVALGEIEPGCYPPQLRQSQELVDLRV
ncbi:MAG TPA: LuxR family transcriptional regulator [Nevskiaceae bacterium]|nr:LuxR family transcriptional regulator [Nevskiaceae bacterium]